VFIHRYVVRSVGHISNQAYQLFAQARVLGFELEKLDCHDVYHCAGDLSEADRLCLAEKLFKDSFLKQGRWEDTLQLIDSEQGCHIIEVSLRDGVSDIAADHIMRGARILGLASLKHVSVSQRFLVMGKQALREKDLRQLAEELLSNPVIEIYSLEKMPKPLRRAPSESNHTNVLKLSVRDLNDEELIKLAKHRRSALDLNEMQTIKSYFISQERDPTDIEFEMIAQTWSEHCSHKTFKAKITYSDRIIDGLLKSFIQKATREINAPWVRSAFVDNAGIIDFDDDYELSFKVETHNHPSAIEPFGGANTGMGGVIRDILGVSATPIAATDIFCFGSHSRRIESGVIAGVEDYGNKTGIPIVNGAVYYDQSYSTNPLVFCGCLGIAPKNKHPTRAQADDRIIVIGGKTGRDGLRGATFSSMTMDQETPDIASVSVQIGHPIMARALIEVVAEARDQELYHAITDCGAGGLSSAVGEMAALCGAAVELEQVKLKYQGLAPWEIWLSEAQERMVMAVPSSKLKQLQAICAIFECEMSDIGCFTDSGEIIVNFLGHQALKLSNKFLHQGMPQQVLWAPSTPSKKSLPPIIRQELADPESMLLALLAHPNISSKEKIIRLYDHEVQGASVIRPLVGANNDGPSDACVLKPSHTKSHRGLVLSNGMNPELGKYSPYAMAISAIDEAIRNAVAVGADPDRIAILDNFCFGNVKRPEVLSALVETAHACYDAATYYQTPFISGKDSLNNEYQGPDGESHAIIPTLVISALGIIDDVNLAVSMDFKSSGHHIYVLGSTSIESSDYAKELYRRLHQAIKTKLIQSCHDLSEGGLAVALAEMSIGGRLGCCINLGDSDLMMSLFGEFNARLLVEVKPQHAPTFEQLMSKDPSLPYQKLGITTENELFEIFHHHQSLISLPLTSLINAYFKQEIRA